MRHRILFYSHDSFGLGHLRRCLTIASYLTRRVRDLSALMLTGLDSPAAFEHPKAIDFVKLPSIVKSGPDEYRSRHLRVSFARVRRMREYMIRTVVRAFEPHIVVVDNVPRGVEGELLPTLRALRKSGAETLVALTLRDVLDTPEHIVPLWKQQRVYDVLRRLYDEIWIAGSQEIFDPTRLYEFPEVVRDKVHFCGYVVRSSPAGVQSSDLRREFHLGNDPVVVASCGGGGDGYPLMAAFAEAVLPMLESGVRAVMFLGPDMPPAERRRLRERLRQQNDRVIVFDFRPDLVSFLQIANVSVSMGGYNTACEVVASGVPAIIVPRVQPRFEQHLRAEAFEKHGLVHIAHLAELRPERLRESIRSLLTQPRARREGRLDLAGLRRIERRVRRHLSGRSGAG